MVVCAGRGTALLTIYRAPHSLTSHWIEYRLSSPFKMFRYIILVCVDQYPISCRPRSHAPLFRILIRTVYTMPGYILCITPLHQIENSTMVFNCMHAQCMTAPTFRIASLLMLCTADSTAADSCTEMVNHTHDVLNRSIRFHLWPCASTIFDGDNETLKRIQIHFDKSKLSEFKLIRRMECIRAGAMWWIDGKRGTA